MGCSESLVFMHMLNVNVTWWTGEADEDKQKLVQQLVHLDASYNGGLVAYINNAKQLLQDSREGRLAPKLTISHLPKLCNIGRQVAYCSCCRPAVPLTPDLFCNQLCV